MWFSGGGMCQLKFRCPECGGDRLIFTTYNKSKGIPHGAVCKRCKATVTKEFFWGKNSWLELAKT